MSFESIIGITSGVLGIITGIWGLREIRNWIRRKFEKRPISEVFIQLTDKKLQDIDRRAFLKELNSYPQFNDRIKVDYIQKFTLGKRGKEDLLFDICDSNDIEPNDDICKGLLGYFSSSLLTKYQEKRKNSKDVSIPTNDEYIKSDDSKMTTESLSGEQTVYLSELLKNDYYETCNRLTQILDKHNVKYAYLKGTKDIWCRDYMPIQTESGKFIQFRYDPSYLKGNKEWEESRSDVKEVCRLNNIDAQFSDINLDGGNVLICEGRAIISDRIYAENPEYEENALNEELSRLLECEIIIIPAQKSDMTGHADGMVRFVDKNTILGNNLDAEYKYWREGMQKVIEKYGLKYINMPFFEPKDSKHPLSAIGVYVNYLEVRNLIVLPVFGKDEDKQALDIIHKAFPDKAIETIDYNDVAFEGGLLNCTTWVITNN